MRDRTNCLAERLSNFMPEVMTEQQLEWTVYPARKNLGKTIILLLVIGLTSLAVYLFAQDIFLAALAVVFLVGSMVPYFVPTRYTFTPEEIRVARNWLGRRSYKWSVFKSYFLYKSGVLLSPYTRQSLLESFRGLHLLFNDNKETVVNYIKNKVTISTN